MHANNDSAFFTLGTLPSNEYAMAHQAYFNPSDFSVFQSQSRSSTIFIELNGFILKADAIPDIPKGQIGLSKFQRESYQIGKTD